MNVINLNSARPAPAVPCVHLNLNVRGLDTSATLAINEQSAALQQAGKTAYRLGLGQSLFPVPDSVVKALQENTHQKDYLPVRRHPRLFTCPCIPT